MSKCVDSSVTFSMKYPKHKCHVVHFDTFLKQQKDNLERTHMKNLIWLKEKEMQYILFLNTQKWM